VEKPEAMSPAGTIRREVASAPRDESFADLEAMIRDAVEGYFADKEKPERIRLHFVRDPELALA